VDARGLASTAVNLEQVFLGTWSFRRRIYDYHSNVKHIASGEATYKQLSSGVYVYAELGLLANLNQKFSRRYIYDFTSLNRVTVYFFDPLADNSIGELFYCFSYKDKKVVATNHKCGDDFYTTQIDIINSYHYKQSWHVRGPRKNYMSICDYGRSQI